MEGKRKEEKFVVELVGVYKDHGSAVGGGGGGAAVPVQRHWALRLEE